MSNLILSLILLASALGAYYGDPTNLMPVAAFTFAAFYSLLSRLEKKSLTEDSISNFMLFTLTGVGLIAFSPALTLLFNTKFVSIPLFLLFVGAGFLFAIYGFALFPDSMGKGPGSESSKETDQSTQ